MKTKVKEIEMQVYGRVQGIGFRIFVKSIADRFGVKGFSANNENGSVLIVAQGSKGALERFVLEVQKSPGISDVSGINYKFRDLSGNYRDFKVIRKEGFFKDRLKSLVNLGKYVFGIDKGRVPKHIAIIPDGNRRWARSKGLSATFGHYKSGDYGNMKGMFEEARRLGVKYVSIWGFSTENWKRSKSEVKAIFELIARGVEKFRQDSRKSKIRFKHIGRKDRLPKKLSSSLEKLEKETEKYGDFVVQLCLDYGGRDEIVRAVNKIIKKGIKKVDEKIFSGFLDTAGAPEPDLIIRTSGEKRISGLMPFQSVYSEFYFTDVAFPDFDAKELKKAIKEFQVRNRRFGGQ